MALTGGQTELEKRLGVDNYGMSYSYEPHKKKLARHPDARWPPRGERGTLLVVGASARPWRSAAVPLLRGPLATLASLLAASLLRGAMGWPFFA